ncbi:MAG: hypothetical protein COA44_01265 [Arcobacter sp.]|nr:MAG: hypothetical protein COA44_01265 [Arcobacter sp.]
MKHFDTIINNMVKIHKDFNTQYSSTTMFASKNELSFAISRLMDAQRVLIDEPFDNKEITSEIWSIWLKLRDEMPSQTANDIALYIIKNTPLSSTQEQINELQDLFYKAMYTYTNHTELSKVFTEIIFGEGEAKMPRMRDH